uniref:Uncharacterized protein n=1 Tax=Cacopsylla melanoneura TaxID=428564 RepID=A0A8D8UL60_9HEMI
MCKTLCILEVTLGSKYFVLQADKIPLIHAIFFLIFTDEARLSAAVNDLLDELDFNNSDMDLTDDEDADLTFSIARDHSRLREILILLLPRLKMMKKVQQNEMIGHAFG